jgi:hypothetical protein
LTQPDRKFEAAEKAASTDRAHDDRPQHGFDRAAGKRLFVDRDFSLHGNPTYGAQSAFW